jgi:hypothetical protein
MNGVTFQAETLQIVTGLLYIAFPLLAWFALKQTALPSLVTWCIASFIGGLGLAWIGVGAIQDDFNWVVWGQILIMYSFMLRTQALKLDRGLVINHELIVSLSAGFGFVSLILNTLPNPWAADLWIRTGNFFLVWFFIAEIRRFAMAFESRSAYTMMWVYLLVALAVTFNLSVTLHSAISNFEAHRILGPTLTNSLAIFVASVVGHMSYLGMTAERSIDKLASAREQYQKSKAWQEKAQELTLVDRQLSLGLISNSLTHAISQPLSSMLIHTRLAQRLLQKPDFDRENLVPHIELITTETKRTSETIENIRRFIRPVDNKPQDFAVSVLLDNIRQLLYQETLIQNIELKWAPETAHIHLFADLTQTTQACLIVLQKVFAAIPFQNGKFKVVSIRIKPEEDKTKLIFIYPGTEIDIKSLEVAQMIVSIASGSIYPLGSEDNQSVLCIELQNFTGFSTPHVHAAKQLI